jgi:hypothetical protein
MKYERKAKPLAPIFGSYKLHLIISLVLCIVVFISVNFEWKEKALICNVHTPISKTVAVEKYEAYNILSQQQVELKNLNFIETFLFKGSSFWEDNLTVLYCIIILAFATYLTYKTNAENAFKTNLSKSIFWLGILLISFGVIDYVRDYWVQMLVIKQTKNLFILDSDHFVWMDFKLIIGAILIWLSIVFKKGEVLQQEADLTI